MKKIYNLILTALLMTAVALPSAAQDERGRKTETIVQDVLALMPTQNRQDFNREMGYLAKSAPESIKMLAALLKPAEQHSNAQVEYAISGAVAYATTNDTYRKAVQEGLKQALVNPVDDAAKVFLQLQLRLLSKENDVTYTQHTGATPYAEEYDKLVSLGDKAGAEIVKSVKSKDHAYRMQALKFATDHNLVTEELARQVAGKYSSCSDEGKTDILNWLGDNKVASQKPLMQKAVKKGGTPAKAAIEALGRIGGEDAAETLVVQLGGENNAEALRALASYKEDLNAPVSSALKTATGAQQTALLQLAGMRRLKSTEPQVIELAKEGNQDARKALAGVVTKDNTEEIAILLDKAGNAEVSTYQQALKACVSSLDGKTQYQTISTKMRKAQNASRFYAVLAATGADESVVELQKIYEGSKDAAALDALKQSTNYKAASVLLEAAKTGDEEALADYVNLVNQNETDVNNRYTRLNKALSIAKSANARQAVLKSLGSTPTRNSFITVGKYLDDKDVNYTACAAEKDIINKTDEDIEYDIVNTNLNKCIEIYKAHGTADDGYAVDELKKILAEQKPSPVFQLPEEEKKLGYEVLFDGTNLDKWCGNKVGYLPINGNIYVTANYGNESNLYTVKEYRDFIYKFEFCFVKPGVNNGVGIRTPMGVDAAYDGMCECQILDHDDPIYADLHEYQVHGSVYGVIPAKRIKHKPLGEWSQEEIRVKGNHITVIVNGETIVDGDVKEACQGHNVAPDGSSNNPYTVDHRNHPGMFNEKGHISFCGHGLGVKFRNIRVLDLSNQKSAKKSRK